MKTFIIHISVDAESRSRAKEIVEDRIHRERRRKLDAQDEMLREGEVVVVLDSIDEIED